MKPLRLVEAPRNPPIVICYMRVSTYGQAESRLGLDAQKGELERLIAYKGYTVLEWIEDAGLSGVSVDGRPGLLRALALLENGAADMLIATKLSRIGRSVADINRLFTIANVEGWSLLTLDLGDQPDSATGRLMRHIIAAFAEFERDLGSERTREALAVKKGKGEKIGGQYKITRPLSNAIFEMREMGWTLQAIADVLNRRGIPTARPMRNGKATAGLWTPGTIRMHLKSREESGPPTEYGDDPFRFGWATPSVVTFTGSGELHTSYT